MDSQRSKFIASIYQLFYNISPVPGSIQFVLASPDTEKATQTLPISKVSASPFLHEDMLRSGQITGVERSSTNPMTPPNFIPIQLLLPVKVGAPSCSLPAEIPPSHCGPSHQILNNFTSFCPNDMPRKWEIYTCPIYPKQTWL